MRLTSRALVCVLLVACCSSAGLADAGNPVCAAHSTGAFVPAALRVPEPVEQTGCYVSIDCDYPPPASLWCYGTTRCSAGIDDYGWVECEGVRTYCSPPSTFPGCIGSCFSTVQCWDICNAGGVEPTSYQCNSSGHCCQCYYD